MLYAQFYQMSTGYIAGTIPPQFGEKKLIEACGDRAVVILDGRVNGATNGQIAADECEKREYVAWRIFKGDSFTSAKPVSGLWHIQKPEKHDIILNAYA